MLRTAGATASISNTSFPSDISDIDKLKSLIATANSWGRLSGWPAAKDYQYEEIRAIGQKIHEAGGL